MLEKEYWVCIELDDFGWYTFSRHDTLRAARTGAKRAAKREHGYGTSVYIREVKTLPRK
jgi:hypothetical protein